MANGVTDDGTADQSGPAPSPDPSGSPGGPPQGGGPNLAAIQRQREGTQVSAPGPGNIASGLMQLKTAVDMIQAALQSLPAGSQQHKDALKAITALSRHLPQGQPTAGAQQTQLGDLLRQTIRNAVMQRIQMRGQGGGGDGGDQPSPSTPLPGA